MSKKITRTYFGTDGIRGKVGQSLINPQFMLHLAWAVGNILLKEGAGKVLIGRDTRISGQMLESALQAGFNAAGIDVRLLGEIPTPAIAYLTKSLRASASIVISASHNPYYDSGVKIFNAKGEKLSDESELAIEAQLNSPVKTVDSKQLGRSKTISDGTPRYIEFCKQCFPKHLDLSGIKVVIDCANGAGFYVGPSVLRELGASVIPICDTPNGININDQCGATDTHTLSQKVIDYQADVGIALDGDGDRLIMVDHKGEAVDGDEILCILAKHYHDKKQTIGVAGTIMSNLGLAQALERMAIPFKRTKVGDRHVLEMLKAQNWTLGGETSGHIINLDFTATGDGIVSALQILAIMQKTGKSLNELKSCMKKHPQILINVPLKGKRILQDPCFLKEIKLVEKALQNQGRLVIRPSGTEPLLRIMVEAIDKKIANDMANTLAEMVKTRD